LNAARPAGPRGLAPPRSPARPGAQSWDTTDTKLRCYFENWGVVKESFVSYDRETGKPRGFGFVVFDDASVADRVVQNKHTIDRREVRRGRPRARGGGPC